MSKSTRLCALVPQSRACSWGAPSFAQVSARRVGATSLVGPARDRNDLFARRREGCAVPISEPVNDCKTSFFQQARQVLLVNKADTVTPYPPHCPVQYVTMPADRSHPPGW